MQWLLPNTDQITPHSAVYDPLLGNIGQLSVYCEYAHTRSYDHTELSRAVETAVQIVLLKHCAGRDK